MNDLDKVVIPLFDGLLSEDFVEQYKKQCDESIGVLTNIIKSGRDPYEMFKEVWSDFSDVQKLCVNSVVKHVVQTLNPDKKVYLHYDFWAEPDLDKTIIINTPWPEPLDISVLTNVARNHETDTTN